MCFDAKNISKKLKKKSIVYGLILLVVSSVITGFSGVLINKKVGIPTASMIAKMSAWQIFLSITLYVFAFSIIYSLALHLGFKILKKGSYTTIINTVGYAFLMFSIWLFIAVILTLIYKALGGISLVLLWLGFVHCAMLKMNLLKELLNIDFPTVFITVLVVLTPLIILWALLSMYLSIGTFTTVTLQVRNILQNSLSSIV